MKEPKDPAHLSLLKRIELDPTSELPKGRQLYLKLYEAIREGFPGYGALLPPTRELAQHLGIGRNSVTQVYEQLGAEGLVQGKGRAGTRVVVDGLATIESQVTPKLSSRVPRCIAVDRSTTFSPGEPDTGLFPQRDWVRALTKSAREEKNRLGYQRDNGHPALVQGIARFLAQYRGLRVNPEQIVVTAGTRQSLMLASALYTAPGDIAWVEEPGYPGVVAAWRSMGLKLQPCKVDRHGLKPPPLGVDPRIIYTTPCFQYPTGSTLTVSRRHLLLKHASACGAVIFEDDYDSEFRDQSQPAAALASESTAAVIHAGTFSKLIFPAMRVAWMVLPQEHVPTACQLLADIGGGHNAVMQLAVARLLDEGVVARHLVRARHVYAQRRKCLLETLDQYKELMSYRDSSGGLSLVVDLNKPVNYKRLECHLRQAKLGAQPLESLYWSRERSDHCTAIVLGLGNVPSMSIPDAVNKLKWAIENAAL